MWQGEVVACGLGLLELGVCLWALEGEFGGDRGYLRETSPPRSLRGTLGFGSGTLSL